MKESIDMELISSRIGYGLLLVLAISCQKKEQPMPAFEYEIMTGYHSGILIKNFNPTTKKKFAEILLSVNDSLKMDSVNVFILAGDINRINPEFKKKYFRGRVGRMNLEEMDYDTLRVLKTLRMGLGTFKGKEFIKNDNWDSLLLNNRFYLKE
jgi:hypothetical protein